MSNIQNSYFKSAVCKYFRFLRHLNYNRSKVRQLWFAYRTTVLLVQAMSGNIKHVVSDHEGKL